MRIILKKENQNLKIVLVKRSGMGWVDFQKKKT